MTDRHHRNAHPALFVSSRSLSSGRVRGQVRIRVEACGVCHSDAGTVEGQLPGVVYPRVPGHSEAIGRIEEVGRGVVTWKVGQRKVGVGSGGEDGTCEDLPSGRHGILPEPHYHWRDE